MAANSSSPASTGVGDMLGTFAAAAVTLPIALGFGVADWVSKNLHGHSESNPDSGQQQSQTTFTQPRGHGLSSLAGMHQLKTMLLEEVVEPLRNPEKYAKYRIEIPNGILMYGPPGCGKTFIAKRLANELGRAFFEVSPSQVASSYVHGSTLKIRELFEAAAKHAPALMFVDEFEGLVPTRRGLGSEQQHKAEEVNEWLVQLGSCAERRILFVAATNEPWSIDEAVQRSGRLDKKVYVGPPDVDASHEILMHHLHGRPISSESDLANFALEIEGIGYSSSDLKVIADEAAKLAMKTEELISFKHLLRIVEMRVRPSISQATLDRFAHY